jgi:ribulose-phosphate 3-epimerase
VLQKIKEKGIKAGVAINPSTEVDSIEGILDRVDYVLVMTVNPGFSGQKMIKDALGKIDILRGIREKQNLNFEIGVDGGINRDNIKEVITHGPDIIVSASAIFNGKIKENINFLRNAMSVSVNGSGNS